MLALCTSETVDCKTLVSEVCSATNKTGSPGCFCPDAVWLLQAWDEFKPYKKENKHTKARERVRTSASSMNSEESMEGPLSAEQGSQLRSSHVGCSLLR